MLFTCGQWDAWNVIAALVGVWALQASQPEVLGLAVTLLIAKPNTVLPVVLVLLISLWRRSMKFRLRVFYPIAGTVVLSFFIWGWWVPGYLAFMHVDSPGTMEVLVTARRTYPVGLRMSMVTRVLFVIAWLLVLYRLRGRGSQVAVAFALVFGVVLWPYANLYNYVNTAPVIAWLFATHRRLGIAAVLAELGAIGVLLAGGPAWLLPLVWPLVGVVVTALEPDASVDEAPAGALSPAT